MSIYKIVGLSIISLICISILKRTKEEYAVFISTFVGVSLIAVSVSILTPLIEYIKNLENAVGLGSLFQLLFKSTGVAIITSIAADICRDLGESSLSSKVELCGKCTILSLSLPLIKNVLEKACEILVN